LSVSLEKACFNSQLRRAPPHFGKTDRNGKSSRTYPRSRLPHVAPLCYRQGSCAAENARESARYGDWSRRTSRFSTEFDAGITSALGYIQIEVGGALGQKATKEALAPLAGS
jgi:hypothetical protein